MFRAGVARVWINLFTKLTFSSRLIPLEASTPQLPPAENLENFQLHVIGTHLQARAQNTGGLDITSSVRALNISLGISFLTNSKQLVKSP